MPKYPELSVATLWGYIKEVDELVEYFPDMKEGELPERHFLWSIVCTKRKEETEELVKQARAQRSSSSEEKVDDLIEIDPSIFDKIQNLATQKRKFK